MHQLHYAQQENMQGLSIHPNAKIFRTWHFETLRNVNEVMVNWVDKTAYLIL